MDCPICGGALATTTHESVELAECAQHHGVFCSYDALGMMATNRSEPTTAAEASAAIAAEVHDDQRPDMTAGEPLKCPQCGVAMMRAVYAYESGVVIDTCYEHGAWLDDGELRRIEAWIEGTEVAAVTDAREWQPKLDAIERDYDDKAAGDIGGVHAPFIGGPLKKVARWWLSRDDASRHHGS